MADNWLRQYGFNSVELPRRDLKPLDLLLKGNDGQFTTKVGDLSMIMSSERQPPGVTSDEPTANIARKITRKVKAKLGLSILGALLGGATGSKLGAEGGLNQASDLSVTYGDVVQDSTAVIGLQAWLQDAQVDAPNQTMVWLNDEKLAAVTGVLRSAVISVSATRQNGASLELDIPAISGLVSGTGEISLDRSSGSQVTFTGPQPIAFGLQAFKLVYEGNVSFGLEEVHAIAPVDYSRKAWTSESEIAAIADGRLDSEDAR
jgi:hypothetical protein